jgi:hypothetical protein
VLPFSRENVRNQTTCSSVYYVSAAKQITHLRALCAK